MAEARAVILALALDPASFLAVPYLELLFRDSNRFRK